MRRTKNIQKTWEQCKLGEVADIIGGGTPSTEIDEYWNGNIDWYSPFEIGSQIFLNGSRKKITEVGLQKSSANVLPVGTVLFTSRAGIGNTAILAKEGSTNQGFQSIVSHAGKLDSYFVYSRTHELKRYGEITGAGSTFIEISGKQMAKMPIKVPHIEEQVKIGSFFKQLDDTITLHQRKIDALVQLKQGFLQQMFPMKKAIVPRVRFANFKSDWEQRKWVETVDISTDMVDPRSEIYNELPHVAPGNIKSFTGQLYDNIKLVKEENLISGKFRFHAGDIIYGKINPQLGKYIFARFEGLTSADAYVLNAKNNLHQKFLFSILQTKNFYDYSVSVSKRSGMPKINRNELNAYNYFAPSFAEQFNIGELFLNVDNLIELQQQKVYSLNKIKRAFLQKMFI